MTAVGLTWALTLGAVPVATAEAPQAAPQPPPCAAEAYRQFDFWIGDWDVKDAAGEIVGSNQIEPILGGCALQEHWSGRAGSVGHSLNMFDRSTGRWHQTWTDNSGLLLQLDGERRGDSMTLAGERVDRTGARVRHQIGWQVRLDGSVRQHWQSSTDGGQTWTTVFDGLYIRKAR
jgi:hypothetical protein